MIAALRFAILSLLGSCLPPAFAAVEPAPAAAPKVNHASVIFRARTAWSADGKELAEVLVQLRAAVTKATALEKDLASDRQALARLLAEKAQALADLRSGAFCTGCQRTRSDILAHGESFPHSGQRSRPATPAELESAERSFDARIDAFRRKIARMEPDFKSAESASFDLHHRFQVLVPQYHAHLADEQIARVAKWLDEKAAAESELKAVHEAIATKAKEAGKTDDPAQAEAADKRLEALNRQLTQRITAGKSAGERARQEERSFRRDAQSSIDSLAGLAAGVPARSGVDGAHMASQLRNPPRPIGYSVPAIYVGGDGATVNELQRLLNGQSKTSPTPDTPKSPASGEKSVSDLLNGK